MKYRLKPSGAALSAVLGAAMILAPLTTQADVLISVQSAGNDCAGVFGDNFDACVINESPIIIKYDDFNDTTTPGVDPPINSLFTSIDGTEFDITFTDGSNSEGIGTWIYTQGIDDPNVRYWVAKAGSTGFNMFFMVENIDAAPGGACASAAAGGTLYDDLTPGCMDQALVVTTGSFATPARIDDNGNVIATPSLSHISFYDTGSVPDIPPSTAPAPSSITLFGVGALLGAITYRRRKRQAAGNDRTERAIVAA